MNPLELQVLAILSGIAGGAQTAGDKPVSFMEAGAALFVAPPSAREIPKRRPAAARPQPHRS